MPRSRPNRASSLVSFRIRDRRHDHLFFFFFFKELRLRSPLTCYHCLGHPPRPEQVMQQFDRVEVESGDLLIVPRLWWHAVVTEGRCIAVNWWWAYPPSQSTDFTVRLTVEVRATHRRS